MALHSTFTIFAECKMRFGNQRIYSPLLSALITFYTVLPFNEMSENKNNIVIKNLRATFDYEIIDTYTAGIVLTGTEIKSLRMGKASLVDCFCYFHRGELFVRGMNISEYSWGSYNNHQPKRDRKLLFQTKELRKLERSLQDKGLTIVGLRMFINDRGLAKLQIGLAKGRKSFDKREYLKEKDAKREMDRVMKR